MQSANRLPVPGPPGPSRPPATLIAIGYWSGPHASPDLPDVDGFIDETWDEDDRLTVLHYVQRGVVAAACMGYSTCRVCGRTDNGNLDLTDGFFVWPEGLAHYVAEHAVRLPDEFMQHVYTWDEALHEANSVREKSWWVSFQSWSDQH